MRKWINVIKENELNESDIQWTYNEAVRFVDMLRKGAGRTGYSIDIVGGVRKRGESVNDLDLKLTPEDDDADIDDFLMWIESKNISVETISVPGGPVARIYLSDDREVDLFL